MRPTLAAKKFALILVLLVLAGERADAGLIGQLKTFNVDVGYDKPDSNPGDGICNLQTDPDKPPACTLRAAIMEANTLGSGWSVEVRLAPGTTYLLQIPGPGEDLSGKGDLDVLRPMRIGIPSSASLRARVNAAGLDRAFHFHADAEGSLLYGVEVFGGEAGQGAAVLAAEDLTIERSAFRNNGASSYGASIVDIQHGRLLLRSSRIHRNGKLDDPDAWIMALRGKGDGVFLFVESSTIDANNGTGIFVTDGSWLRMVNATVSGNTLDGIYLRSANALVRSATLVGNATRSSGFSQVYVHPYQGMSAGLDIRNSILAGSAIVCDVDEKHAGIFFDSHSNIYGDDSCESDEPADGSLHGTDPLLADLTMDAWRTPVHVPLAGSPAIDRAEASLCEDDEVDQRGKPRPVAYIANLAPRCDTGAVELEAPEGTGSGKDFADGFE